MCFHIFLCVAPHRLNKNAHANASHRRQIGQAEGSRPGGAAQNANRAAPPAPGPRQT